MHYPSLDNDNLWTRSDENACAWYVSYEFPFWIGKIELVAAVMKTIQRSESTYRITYITGNVTV